MNNLGFEICTISLTSSPIIITGHSHYDYQFSTCAKKEEKNGCEMICKIKEIFTRVSKAGSCDANQWEYQTIYSSDKVQNVRCISCAVMRQKNRLHWHNQSEYQTI